jgi:hypothetical protein
MAAWFHQYTSWIRFQSFAVRSRNSQGHNRISPTRRLLGWRTKTADPDGLSTRRTWATTPSIRSCHSASASRP